MTWYVFMVLVFIVKWLYALVMCCMYINVLWHVLSIFGYVMSRLGNAAESVKVSHDGSCFTDPSKPKHVFCLDFLNSIIITTLHVLKHSWRTRFAPSCCTISMQLSHRSFGWKRPYCGGVALDMFSLDSGSEMMLCWRPRTLDFSPFP